MTSTLSFDGQSYAIRSAILNVNRPVLRGPNPRRPPITFGLYLETDERSGEDGALAPYIGTIPLAKPPARWPLLDHLPGRIIDDPDHEAWEAASGNDAPSVTHNRLELGVWNLGDATLALRWTGRCEDKPLCFRGRAQLEPMNFVVSKRDGLRHAVEAVWGPGALVHFEIVPRKAHAPDVEAYRLWPRFLGPRAR